MDPDDTTKTTDDSTSSGLGGDTPSQTADVNVPAKPEPIVPEPETPEPEVSSDETTPTEPAPSPVAPETQDTKTDGNSDGDMSS
ncbi:hypothetical protein A2Z22_03300 [Candidatus Woesebacteria bacterium RBG_16_34_12]|uniref:Uncharacterized protein n=1 Tax=Candidatus Woesebacteria bacterium RBG_16_34_12 TaxID=1802480 RepID=A0A1F7XAP7_9BACT|nr:MAG: hypothetical protein A2Z22_03300 [Candidatus Woesebacteria bacterium RBG_16_34_12]